MHKLPTPPLTPCLFQTGSAYLPKKSRLPILIKSSRPLGNVPLTSGVQKSGSNLQHLSRAPCEGPKGGKVQTEPLQPQTNGEELLNESVTANLPEEPAQESTPVRGE